jgi:hypothetical protein
MDFDRGLPPEVPTRPGAESADTALIDALVTSLYQSLSGPPGARDWDPLRALFHPQARLTWTRPEPGMPPWVMSVEEFLASATRYFETQGMFEVEIHRRSEVFGAMAHVFSSYEARHDADESGPFARGINSIQLIKENNRWWVLSMVWDDERPDQPIPSRYLP